MMVHEHYGRKQPIPYASKHGETETVLPDWMVGIELEIENFNPEATRTFGGFTFTTDGSLRETENGVGIEAVSKPVASKHLEKLLLAFFKKFEITEENYSERCSTHIHVNVDILTYEQISSICLIYQTVESLLFAFVGEDRDNNIFCVPWNQCALSYNIVTKIRKFTEGDDNPFRRWQKYSALNLIPIHTQGTIEFRHLAGTCDVKHIMDWTNLLLSMVKYSLTHGLMEIKDNILQMNTVSNYNQWLTEVFGKYAYLLQLPGCEQILAKGVIDSKIMVCKEKELRAAPRMIFDEAWTIAGAAVPPPPRFRPVYNPRPVQEELIAGAVDFTNENLNRLVDDLLRNNPGA